MWRRLLAPLCVLDVSYAFAATEHVRDAFEPGWVVIDTNGDGIADAVAGKIVVPAHPSSTENAAAANLAARIGFASTGLTLPIVVTAADQGPRIWVGKGAVPESVRRDIAALVERLDKDEGGVFAAGGHVAVPRGGRHRPSPPS